jgi:hypothetical protein
MLRNHENFDSRRGIIFKAYDEIGEIISGERL